MEKILINLNLIMFLIFLYKRTRHGLHILQLENYYNDRYLVWMKKNIKKVLNINTIVLLTIPILIFIQEAKLAQMVALIVNILAYGALIITTKKAKEKKAFVNTARIKRMYGTYFLIILAIWLCANLFDYRIALGITNIVAIMAYALVYVVNILNRPLENYLRSRFCRKAKQKLNEMRDLKIIGITGSYGKTSVKYIINTILSQKYNTLMTPESYNTTMGVVRTINEKLTGTHQLFVCEMGAKYVGDIKEICDIVKPTYGILTAIGPQHLDTFKSLENVKKTKLELANAVSENNGIAFVNWEDENIKSASLELETKFNLTESPNSIIKYGLTNEVNYYADNIYIDENGSTFDVVIPNKEKIKIKTKLLGKLNILNIVSAVAIADALGLTADEIKVGVKYIKPVPHRLELIQNKNGSIIIDDAYNSNIKGAKMALEVLKSFENKRRILITPGIVDLGAQFKEINKEFGKYATKSSDYIILVGEEQTIPILEGIQEEHYPSDKCFVAKNLEAAFERMNEIIDENSVVLLENDLPDNYL